MKIKDYKVLLELVRKYGIATILRFVADAWGDVWHEKYEIKSIGAKTVEPKQIERICKNCVLNGTDVCIEHCDDHWMPCFKPKAESEDENESNNQT